MFSSVKQFERCGRSVVELHSMIDETSENNAIMNQIVVFK